MGRRSISAFASRIVNAKRRITLTMTASSAVGYIFRLTSNAWIKQAFINASHTSEGDLHDWKLSLSGDGNTLAVGAADEDGSASGINGVDSNSVSHSGGAYIFEFNNSTWSQRAYIKAGDNSANSWFGNDVSLNEDRSNDRFAW